MGKSTEFNRDSDTSVKDVATKSGPMGLLLVFYIAVSMLGLIVLLIWWLSRG